MDFIVNNWLVFGGVWAFFFFVLVLNFILAARSAWAFNMDGVKNRTITHVILSFLTIISFIPFAIGAVVFIVRYASKQ